MCIRDRSWDSPLIPTCRLARLLPTKPSSFDSAVKCSRSSTSAVAANSAASCGWPVAPALSANSVYLAYANASACIAARTEALGTRLRRVRHRLGTSAGSRGARRLGCRRGRPRAWTIADETALRTGQAVRVLGPGLRGDLPEDGG